MRHMLVLAVALVLVACVLPFGSAPDTGMVTTTPTLVGFATLAVTPTEARSPTVPVTPLPSLPAVSGQIAVREAVGTGRAPGDMAILGDKMYVSNEKTDNIAVIQNSRIIKFIAVGSRPGPITVDPVEKRVYVANVYDRTLNLIVDDAIVKTAGIGDWVSALAYVDGRVVAATQSKGILYVLDPVTLQQWIDVKLPDASEIINIAVDAERHRLYANTYRRIAVVDTKTWKVVNTFKVDGDSTLAVYPQRGLVLVDGWDSGISTQYLIAYDANTGKEAGRVKIGSDPRGAAISADGSRVYVANAFSNDVTVIDPQKMTVVATIPVGMSPKAVELDESSHRLYVTNSESDNISVIDTEKLAIASSIPLAPIFTAVLGNEIRGRIYIANASTDSVYVIEGSKIVKEIGVGRHPIDLARDSESNRIFVANGADNTLSIIDENDYTVQTTEAITRQVTTVAVDNSRSRVYVNDVVMDLKTLKPVDKLVIRSQIYQGMWILPDQIWVQPGSKRLYVGASNGTPGSNGRWVLYSMSGEDLASANMLHWSSGNTTAVAFDPESNRVFETTTHPLAYTNEFHVYDANDRHVAGMQMTLRTTDMVYNPNTHHLFLSQKAGEVSYIGSTPVPSKNALLVVDGDSFGTVAQLDIKAPGLLGRIGNMIYLADRENWTVTMVQDVKTAQPASPTPTVTPSPYPTATATPIGQKATPTWTPLPIPSRLPSCAITTPAYLGQKLTPEYLAKLGCPVDVARNSNFAVQTFQNAQMFWREDVSRIYVLYSDKMWAAYDDTWATGQPEDSCPTVSVPAGMIKPIRGFGKIWCGTPGVRTKTGAAMTKEMGLYSAPVLKFERGLVFGGEGGQVFVLFSDARWE